ncbi:MAG: DUF4258 domain-containing protein [Clostridia bacterium]|nr:DUF4258 domain-containing protein [Clostridia bacterium]
MEVDALRELCRRETLVVSLHCMKRLTERDIGLSEVIRAIMTGEIIEDYPDDYPYPSCLVLGEGLHVVAGVGDGRLWLITAYRPDPDQWEDDMRTRRVAR